MRITEAGQRLGTSPRMLRYRDLLGLLPPVRQPAGAARRGTIPAAGRAPGPGDAGPQGARRQRAGRHRQFGEDDLAAVSLALEIEQRYDISPAALAFGLRVLTDPAARSQVAELGRQTGRIGTPGSRAVDFEKERALRLLSLTPGR